MEKNDRTKDAAPEQKTPKTTSFLKKKSTRIILFCTGGVLLLVLAFFGLGTLLYPFTTDQDKAEIYIFKGEPAKATIDFTNKRASDKVLVLDCKEHGLVSQTLSGKKTQSVDLEFPEITEDTTITAKYGFLKMKKLPIHVTVIDAYQLRLSDVTIKQGNTDITAKQYCPPNKKVVFEVTVYNDSKKAFKRDYSLKIKGKAIDTKTAQWKAGQDSTQLQYEYTFKKQGFYKVQLGDKKISFICSTKDKPPANGKYLLRKISGGSGVLKLKNKYKYPIIVTLCRSSAQKKALNRMYIGAKKTATMSGIKDGTYVVYVKGGKGYSKMAKDILEAITAFKTTKKMKFYTTSRTYSIWTLTLGVSNGNTGTMPIDRNEVPR